MTSKKKIGLPPRTEDEKNQMKKGRPRKKLIMSSDWLLQEYIEDDLGVAVRTLLKGECLGDMEPISGKALVDLIRILLSSNDVSTESPGEQTKKKKEEDKDNQRLIKLLGATGSDD